MSPTLGWDAELLLSRRLRRSRFDHRGHDQSISDHNKPAQPFLDWLHQVDPTSAHLTLEDLQREPTIYLVPECDTEDQAVEYLGESAGTIFEEHLDGWYRVPTVWPTKRDLATFQRWFEFSFHSMIVDLCDDVLEHEEL
jgi:hypothetical protein